MSKIGKVMSQPDIRKISEACSLYRLSLDEVKHIAISVYAENLDIAEVLTSRYKDKKR